MSETERWAGLTHEEVRELAAIVRSADESHEKDGGGTRHWVRDHFLPALEEAGWTIHPPHHRVRAERAQRRQLRDGSLR
jgi:hypothetical protein